MSSILGFSTAALNAPYSASKYALESVSETLALEVKPFGIDVIILQIGDFHSDFLKNATRQSYTEKSPYYKLYKRQDDRLGDGGRGKDPIIVANKIVEICNKKRHPLRYMIGKEVFIKKLIHSLLPGKEWINFLRSFYNW
jgi:NAD(P)-dependent dehydrogenase (short-subunit alcohol dehydrogenase family)